MISLTNIGTRSLGGVAAVSLAAMMSMATVNTADAFIFGLFRAATGGGGCHGCSGKQVVPFSKRYAKGTVVVSFADRRLYFISSPGQAISYPIAAPMSRARWSGTLRVSSKRANPTWTPTPQMRRENPALPASVPGGHPRNPLGPRALYLGSTLYRIHGTDAPWTVGQAVSRGCVRLYNRDILDLYPRVRVGAKVIVTWNRYRS